MKPFQDDMAAERRKYARVRTDSVVSISRLDDETLAHAIDVSLGGIRFQCVGVELGVGDTVRVALTLEDRTISVVGKLVRVTDLDAFTQDVALAFLETDDETERLLRESLPEDQELDPRDQ
jgi:hypothetical protein